MVSALSPQQFQPAQNFGQQLMGAIAQGQGIQQNKQALAMGDQQMALRQQSANQQMNEVDYQTAVRRLQVINRLATYARKLGTPQEREQFKQNIDRGMLQSVGIDPAQLDQTPVDDAGLDSLIAQTASAIPQDQSAANQQFGGQETLKDEKGNLFFATSRRDPRTGNVVGVVAAADGSDAKPVGQLQVTGAYGQTGQERISQVGNEAGARTQATQDVKLDTEPKLQAEITRAKEEVKAQVAKQISQQGQLGKLEDAEGVYNRLKSADLDVIYGQGEKWYPEFLRSQKGINLIADRDQLLGMLQLGARGELKGQGPITDGEQKILSSAVTVLGNPNIGAEKARTAIDDAMNILRRNAGKGGSGQGVMTPGITDKATSKYKIEVVE